jgi:uncharacterized protein YaaQ
MAIIIVIIQDHDALETIEIRLKQGLGTHKLLKTRWPE